MDKIDIKYMSQTIKLAEKAYQNGEVPVAALIVKDNKIISKAYNKKEKDNIALHHAEIVAIIKASKKLKSWRLNGCTMYVSLEPCQMCVSAIIEARIDKVIYGAKINKNNESIKTKMIHIDNIDLINKSEKIIKNFFKEKRQYNRKELL